MHCITREASIKAENAINYAKYLHIRQPKPLFLVNEPFTADHQVHLSTGKKHQCLLFPAYLLNQAKKMFKLYNVFSFVFVLFFSSTIATRHCYENSRANCQLSAMHRFCFFNGDENKCVSDFKLSMLFLCTFFGTCGALCRNA